MRFQHEKGNDGNNSAEEYPCTSGSSSLVARQFTSTTGTGTNSHNNNDNTPNHDNYSAPTNGKLLPKTCEERGSPSLSNGYDSGNLTENILTVMDQNEGLGHQELSVVIVRDQQHAGSQVITMINGVPTAKRLFQSPFTPFKRDFKEEQV